MRRPAESGFYQVRRTFRLTSVLLVFVSLVSASGRTHPARQSDEMKKLDFLIGEWKGVGQEFRPDGSRLNEFSQKAKVQAKSGGSELRIKDEKTYKAQLQPGGPVYHNSTLAATVYYDDAAKLYRWRGEGSYGRKNPLEAKLIDARTLQYGMPFSVTVEPSDGNRRTTIEVTESGEWHETLEVWRKGSWYKAEESVLKKTN